MEASHNIKDAVFIIFVAENLATAPKSVTVILVLTDDADGADGMELPTLRLLDSGGVIWTLSVRVDNRSAMLLVKKGLITPPESSNLRVGSFVPSAPSASSVNTTILL